MTSAVVNFADPVTWGITRVLLVVCLAIEIWAFVSCASQRAEAFGAVGTLPKGAWLAIIGITGLLSGLSVASRGVGLVGLIAIAAAAIYLLDVRPAIKDVVDGHGPW